MKPPHSEVTALVELQSQGKLPAAKVRAVLGSASGIGARRSPRVVGLLTARGASCAATVRAALEDVRESGLRPEVGSQAETGGEGPERVGPVGLVGLMGPVDAEVVHFVGVGDSERSLDFEASE